MFHEAVHTNNLAPCFCGTVADNIRQNVKCLTKRSPCFLEYHFKLSLYSSKMACKFSLTFSNHSE